MRRPRRCASRRLPPAAGAGQEELSRDSESENPDYGHYSLVIHASRKRKEIIIADPYKDYYSQERVFGFEEFDQRWYDFNELPDPISGQPVLVEDDHLLFVVVRRNGLFPRQLGMRVFSL